MDEQRIEAYFNLIQQLLTNLNEVVEILEANREEDLGGLTRTKQSHIHTSIQQRQIIL
ncbi:MAG: hypothetical protein F6K48_04680 [Okeania sp. SIO3H1]|nr:hypothetical protein [Okeania sp. SIO3H1]